jgi:hypothetical protein
MRSVTWIGLSLSCALAFGIAARPAGDEHGANAEPVLEIMSLDRSDGSLELSWSWGGMAVNHVKFNDHRGPFKAVVESQGKGVRIKFEGWGNDPFVASADKVRIIYEVAGKKEIDFVAQAIPGGAVRVRPVDRPVSEGKRIVIGLGDRAAKGVATVSVVGRRE